MDSGSRRDEAATNKTPPEVKVVDRRWWARTEPDASGEAAPLSAKPTYVEELEARLAEKDRLLQGYIDQYKTASTEFEQARARARREVAREVERGRRALLVDLLEVVDNLDRAIDAAADRAPDDPLLAGVRMVRDQFIARLDASGVSEIRALDEPFDPALHEAVSVVPSADAAGHDRVAGIIRRGYRVGDEVLRPAQVAVGRFPSA
jgi:molecular chaperone GrpE